MQLELRKGIYTYVDEDDYPIVSQWKWGLNSGYAARLPWDHGHNRSKKRVYLHRFLIDAGELEVDHLDGDKLNNCRSNLRMATRSQNAQNQAPRNVSGYKGVQRNRDKWQAILRIDYKRISLGTFVEAVSAARAYDRAALATFGPHARINGV